ncbi:crotonase/enoyl-CoA hydratase family protein [Nocardioides deserti]|uniref:Crotonase/enoyl-CoA hydratase family protein n=1 Tax=Nocardioides deserti TaxID=1588644 RepID=A0ABR6U6H1_9ACTN|nr:crotonase/enoyl-CoA hydratase family protein [Nocardioides deserti]MBC2960032.1 crotonase/enoyl-CoA hydratase family protein [Nocardioides deserti]GGO75135.1 enoyl-CoA hydratase [Nocardioides deserti]
MTEPDLKVTEHGRVLVLTMDRPEARNAMSMAMAHQIADALEMLDSRDDLSLGIITGANETFCAGMDLKGFARGERPIVEGRGFAGIVKRPSAKPLIAAVEGYALAGGFEIVLSCDLVVASKAAKFGLPEVKRGLTAAAGGLMKLPQRIPYHLAMDLVLTGRMWPATEAADVHLVNRLADPGEALAVALELAEEIAANAPLALAASKQVMVQSVDWTLEERFDRQEEFVNPVRTSQDAKEGAQAFVEKRDPVWTGR